MGKTGRRMVLAALGLLASGWVQAQISFGIVPATLYWQETSQWCWAASGQTMMNYVGPKDVPQCYEANQASGRTDCCNCPTPAACVFPGWPQFDTWGYKFNETAWGSALSWNQLVAEINAKRPVWFAWAWNGGGGHAMVAKGYFEIHLLSINQRLVLVANPWPPQGRCGAGNAAGPFGGNFEWRAYDEYVGGAAYDHTHMVDIYQVARK